MTKNGEQKSRSIRHLFTLLSDVLVNPSVAREISGLNKALSSQGKLAHFSAESRQIVPMSLNTLKRIADLSVPDGFAALDQLRLDCIRALENESKVNTSPVRETRESLRRTIQQEHDRNQRLREDLMFMTDRLLSALNLAERCANGGSERVRTLFQRERSELLASLGLRSCGTQARREYERSRPDVV